MKKILKPISRIYQTGMSLRNILYIKKIITSHNPPLFTVSVGNISWGGTGKTPVCHWLLELAHSLKKKTMLLSRGYKGKPPHYPYITDENSQAQFSGDEPLMLKLLCKDTHVIVDPKRERAIEFGWRLFKPDIAILDDGFQYLKLKRHLNILIFSANDLIYNWNKIIPYGTWREDKSAINRSDVILVNTTGHSNNDVLKYIEKYILPFKKPIYTFRTYIKSIVSITDFKKDINLPNKNYLLVVGIANPKKVYVSICEFLGTPPKIFLTYPDHYNYKQNDWDKIEYQAQKNNCIILTTLKDAVKLKKFSQNFFALNVKIDFIDKFNTTKDLEEVFIEAYEKYKK